MALLLVVVISITVTPAPPSTDGAHYINIAQSGLFGNSMLAAPFAYRFGAPLIAGQISRLFPISLPGSFSLIAFISAWGVVFVSYLLTLDAGGSPLLGYVTEATAAFSFFTVKFALAVPTMVDVEGLLFLLLASWALVSKRYVLALVLTCVGIFFKEFLVIPGALIFFAKIAEYRKTRSTSSLAWVVATLLLVSLLFLLPRVTIPVSAGYGANLRWDFPTPSRCAYLENLKFILSGGAMPEKLVNIAFSFCSFWLPVLLLATPSRMVAVWRNLEGLRWLCIVHVLLVAAMSFVGGTNIMIFAVYTLPILVIVLAKQLATGIHWAEFAGMLVATLVFNRIPWITGGASSTVDGVTRFYGGWWTLIDRITFDRTLEIIGFVLLFILARIFIPSNPKSFDRAIHT